ncbi:MAG: methyltransferase domain-containing protein [Acidimicrobiia bacterium]|nr:methyltransferase domain-containing protein [Acidimicrobiia bacterium]
MIDGAPVFLCNLCGRENADPSGPLDRETPSCNFCGSNVRTRAMLRALSLELFGVALTVNEFPRIKSIRGLGTSDPPQYADILAQKFDYRDTFHHREPRFDLADPPGHALGTFDFIVSSEVFEHVTPPVERVFASAFQLLKPTGLLLLTVPYSVESSMKEHYPEIHDFGFVRLGDKVTLINRTRGGAIQVFDDPVFHVQWGGDALEMREFNEGALKEMLGAHGFTTIRTYAEDEPRFGILHSERWSLPIAARKGDFAFSQAAARDLIDYYRITKQQCDNDLKRYQTSRLVRLLRKLALI